MILLGVCLLLTSSVAVRLPGPAPPASLPHSFSQTDSFAHWNGRAGGAAVKTNTRQLTGGVRPVFWGLLGPSTPRQQWVPWPEPREERVGLSLCCLGVSQPCSLGFPHKGSPQAAPGRLGLLSKPSERLRESPAKPGEKIFRERPPLSRISTWDIGSGPGPSS